jgi:uncharacterized damage-inducible protein DinB
MYARPNSKRIAAVPRLLGMDIAFIGELYRFNRWANEKTLLVVSLLDPAQFTREMGSSFSSVRDTLVHLVGGEWIWLERWNGHSPHALPTPAELPTFVEISAKLAHIQDGQDQFLQKLDAAKLGAQLSYVNQRGQTWTYPLWQMMVHVVNHSTYHRGQITTLLRQLGARPVMTDFLFYYDEKHSSHTTAAAARPAQ